MKYPSYLKISLTYNLRGPTSKKKPFIIRPRARPFTTFTVVKGRKKNTFDS